MGGGVVIEENEIVVVNYGGQGVTIAIYSEVTKIWVFSIEIP